MPGRRREPELPRKAAEPVTSAAQPAPAGIDVGLASLVEQLSRSVYASGFVEGLYPAQWSGLRYFSEADEPARTISALARYQGIQVAPVSRTVAKLVEKGLVTQRPNPGVRRSYLFDVTPKGRTVLARDPMHAMVAALATMPERRKEMTAECLAELLGRLRMAGAEGDGG